MATKPETLTPSDHLGGGKTASCPLSLWLQGDPLKHRVSQAVLQRRVANKM